MEQMTINDDDIVLTGDRPSGCLHLGHFVGSLKNRLELQDRVKCYIIIADVEALSANFDHPQALKKNLMEVCKDYLAVGLDPNKVTIFVQSQVPELFELTKYLMNMTTVARLERNPTTKAELQTKSFSKEITAGFLIYPVSQASDILAFGGTAIPVGEDQKPVLEATNEIARRFNFIYNTDLFKECRPILSKTPRLAGIDGKAKASKSLGNAILLCDEDSEIKQKVFAMYTDPNHIKVSDPGRVEGNVVFDYLTAFMADDEELEDLKCRYRKGGVGDMTLKNRLFEILKGLITPIRERRCSLNENEIIEILLQGSQRARTAANQVLDKVRSIVGIKYF